MEVSFGGFDDDNEVEMVDDIKEMEMQRQNAIAEDERLKREQEAEQRLRAEAEAKRNAAAARASLERAFSEEWPAYPTMVEDLDAAEKDCTAFEAENVIKLLLPIESKVGASGEIEEKIFVREEKENDEGIAQEVEEHIVGSASPKISAKEMGSDHASKAMAPSDDLSAARTLLQNFREVINNAQTKRDIIVARAQQSLDWDPEEVKASMEVFEKTVIEVRNLHDEVDQSMEHAHTLMLERAQGQLTVLRQRVAKRLSDRREKDISQVQSTQQAFDAEQIKRAATSAELCVSAVTSWWKRQRDVLPRNVLVALHGRAAAVKGIRSRDMWRPLHPTAHLAYLTIETLANVLNDVEAREKAAKEATVARESLIAMRLEEIGQRRTERYLAILEKKKRAKEMYLATCQHHWTRGVELKAKETADRAVLAKQSGTERAAAAKKFLQEKHILPETVAQLSVSILQAKKLKAGSGKVFVRVSVGQEKAKPAIVETQETKDEAEKKKNAKSDFDNPLFLPQFSGNKVPSSHGAQNDHDNTLQGRTGKGEMHSDFAELQNRSTRMIPIPDDKIPVWDEVLPSFALSPPLPDSSSLQEIYTDTERSKTPIFQDWKKIHGHVIVKVILAKIDKMTGKCSFIKIGERKWALREFVDENWVAGWQHASILNEWKVLTLAGHSHAGSLQLKVSLSLPPPTIHASPRKKPLEKTLWTPWHAAEDLGGCSDERFEKLLKEEAERRYFQENGRTFNVNDADVGSDGSLRRLLHTAAYTGHANIVRRLLDRGADPWLPQSAATGITALHEACRGAHMYVPTNEPEKVNSVSDAANHIKVISILVDIGGMKMLGMADKIFGDTPLHEAARIGHLHAIEAILRHPMIEWHPEASANDNGKHEQSLLALLKQKNKRGRSAAEVTKRTRLRHLLKDLEFDISDKINEDRRLEKIEKQRRLTESMRNTQTINDRPEFSSSAVASVFSSISDFSAFEHAMEKAKAQESQKPSDVSPKQTSKKKNTPKKSSW